MYDVCMYIHIHLRNSSANDVSNKIMRQSQVFLVCLSNTYIVCL